MERALEKGHVLPVVLLWAGFQLMEWAVGYTQQSCGLGRQPAHTLGEVGAGLDWPGCTEGHLSASSTTSPAGLLLLLLMEWELLGSESCTQRALLQRGQPAACPGLSAMKRYTLSWPKAGEASGSKAPGAQWSTAGSVCSRAHQWHQGRIDAQLPRQEFLCTSLCCVGSRADFPHFSSP